MINDEVDNDYEELDEIKRKKMQELMNQAVQPGTPQEVIHISDADHFNKIVNNYKDHLIVIDLWAEWCGPCRAFGPVFEATQKQYVDKKVIFVKVNVDKHPDISQQFQVRGIPTTVYITNKKIVHKQPGMLPKGVFTDLLDKILEKYDLN